VKGYAAHEKGTFENIAEIPVAGHASDTPEGKAVAENQLTGALKSLFAVAENYPELKASEQFTGAAGIAEPDRRFDSEFAAVLQRGRTRSEYEDSVVPHEYFGGYVRVHGAAVL